MNVDAIAIASLVVGALSLATGIPGMILASLQLVDRRRQAATERRLSAAPARGRHRRR